MKTHLVIYNEVINSKYGVITTRKQVKITCEKENINSQIQKQGIKNVLALIIN